MIAIAAACISVVAAVVVVAFVATDGFSFGGPSTVTLGQEEAVSASLSTRFVPKDREGKELKTYLVVLVRNGKKTKGVDEALYSLDATPYRFEVTKKGGFSVSDFGDGVPSGRYACHVVEGSAKKDTQESGESFLIDYAPDNKDAREELSVLPSEEGKDTGKDAAPKKKKKKEDPQKTVYRLYREKVDEYTAKYGEPAINADQQPLSLRGLYFVRLADLDGDKTEELVLGYDDPSVDGSMGETACTLDVWTFKDNALVQVGSVKSAVDHEQDAAMWIPIATLDGTPVLFGGRPNVDVQGDVSWYAMVDGKLQAKLRLVVEPASGPESETFLTDLRYFVNGEKVDSSAYYEAEKRVQVTDNYATLGSSPDPARSVQETLQMTNDTIAKIGKAAGDEPSKDAEKPSPTAFIAKDVVEDHTIASYSTSPIGYSQESLWAYPQFAPEKGKPSKALQNLNRELKKAYDDALAKQQNMTLEEARGSDGGGAAEQILWQYDTTAGIQGDIASVRLDRHVYYGGAHGTRFVSGRFYNLTTGEEIPATEALGMSEDEIKQAAASGLDAFFAHTPSDMPELLDTDEAVSDLFQSDRTLIYRTDDAVVACFTEGSLGSVAFGGHEIVIKALTDKVDVGDDLVDNYQQPEE